MSKKSSFLAGLATGIGFGLVLIIIYFGVKSVVGFASSHGIAVVEQEYGTREDKLDDIMGILDTYFYEELEEEDYENAYKGFVDGIGDRYTTYYSKEDYKTYFEDISGTYEGIGAYVGYGEEEGELIIIAPMDGSPSKAAGVKAFDKILEVDGVDVEGMTTTELVKLIKGPEGTDVILTLRREEEILDITVTRAEIEVPTVSHEMLEDKMGYIRISGFDGVTYDQFMNAFADLENQNQEGMIIDLRYNGGGYTHIVSGILDQLLPEGTIYYTEDKNGQRNYIDSDEEKQFNKPIVVLVNESSASASEIMAGAIKDHERGVIVGTQTFGKGLVQRHVELNDGSQISVTIAKYFTPDGHYIHGTGITPDVISEFPEYKEGVEYPEDFDPQLDTAKEELQKLIEQ